MSIAKKGFIEKIEIYNEDDPSIYVVYKYNSLYCYNIFHFPIKGEKIILGEQSLQIVINGTYFTMSILLIMLK